MYPARTTHGLSDASELNTSYREEGNTVVPALDGIRIRQYRCEQSGFRVDQDDVMPSLDDEL